MNFFQRRRFLKHINYLEMIPVQLIDFRYEQNEQMSTLANEHITLLLPKFRNKFLHQMLIGDKRSGFIQIKLDEFGTSTWLLINGKNNVEQICVLLKDKYGENLDSHEQRVTQFLTKLYDNRYITYKQLLHKV